MNFFVIRHLEELYFSGCAQKRYLVTSNETGMSVQSESFQVNYHNPCMCSNFIKSTISAKEVFPGLEIWCNQCHVCLSSVLDFIMNFINENEDLNENCGYKTALHQFRGTRIRSLCKLVQIN